jgi:hypothetical protein
MVSWVISVLPPRSPEELLYVLLPSPRQTAIRSLHRFEASRNRFQRPSHIAGSANIRSPAYIVIVRSQSIWHSRSRGMSVCRDATVNRSYPTRPGGTTRYSGARFETVAALPNQARRPNQHRNGQTISGASHDLDGSAVARDAKMISVAWQVFWFWGATGTDTPVGSRFGDHFGNTRYARW